MTSNANVLVSYISKLVLYFPKIWIQAKSVPNVPKVSEISYLGNLGHLC